MTDAEKRKIRKHIQIICNTMLGNPFVDPPNTEQVEAVAAAVKALGAFRYVSPLPCEKAIKVLQYHVNEPAALFFKDRNTIEALEIGVKALEYKLNTAAEG